MVFKDEVPQASFYKKLGDKALKSKSFNKANEHYIKSLEFYPFSSVIRNSKLSLKQIPNEELSKILNTLGARQQSFLVDKLNTLFEKFKIANIYEIKAEFFKYPFIKYPEIVRRVQMELGNNFYKSPNQALESFFIYIGKYNPNDIKLKSLTLIVLDRLANNKVVENAIFDFADLVRNYGNLIEDKLPNLSEQLGSILESSTEFNQRRFSTVALEVLGERDFSLVKPVLPIFYENIKNPMGILGSLRRKVSVINTPIFQAQIGIVGPNNPHVWVLDASIDTIGSLAKKYPTELEYFIPIIIEQFSVGNLYTKKRSIRALLNFRDAGIDIAKYFPRGQIGDLEKQLLA